VRRQSRPAGRLVPSTREYLSSGFRAFLCAVLSLWLLDVALNVRIIQSIVLGGTVQAPLKDYIALLLLETQVALAFVVVSWAASLPASLVTRSRDTTREGVAVLSGLLSALAMAAHFTWALREADMRLTFVASAATGLVVWVVIRFVMSRHPGGRWSLGRMLQYVLFPALIVGFGDSALTKALRGYWKFAGINTAVVLSLLVISLAIVRQRSARMRSVARWTPVLVITLMVIWSTIRFSSLGAAPDLGSDHPGSARPNIVLIVLDTVRADHLKRYGYERNTMPALERWADGAVVFKRAVSPGGWTAPTHASIFSGLTVSQHGVHYEGGKRVYYTNARDGVRWLPTILSSYGYYRLAVIANPFATQFGIKGFDRIVMSRRDGWYDSTVGSVADHFSPILNGIDDDFCWRLPYLDAKQIVDITERAAPTDGRPVFLFVNMMDAHAPYNPPAEALELLGVEPDRTFRRFRSHVELTRMASSASPEEFEGLSDLYDGELRWIDLQLERLLGWIEEKYGGDTVVIVTSDHGEELGEDGRIGHEYGLPQRILHVPLLVRSPTMEPGEVDDVVSLRRLFDFIRDAGAGKAPGVETIVDNDRFGIISERYQHHILSFLGPEYGLPWVSVFHGDYKAVGPSENRFSVYDIEREGFDRPVEVSDSPGSDRLEAQIDEYWDQYHDRRGTHEMKPATEERLKRLRSLGYID